MPIVTRKIANDIKPAERRRPGRIVAAAPTKKQLKITYRDVGDIKPYARNARHNEKAIQAVANSIQQFGFNVPIILTEDDVIVAGHTRHQAALLLGLTDVPCVVATGLTDDQIRAFRIADNRVSELASWDNNLLAVELQALSESGIEFTGLGFSQEALDCLTSMVQEDCLSAGVMASAEGRRPGIAEDQRRAPTQTRFVFGELTWFVPQAVYRRWAAALRAEHDYVESDMIKAVQDGLGLTPYIEAGS